MRPGCDNDPSIPRSATRGAPRRNLFARRLTSIAVLAGLGTVVLCGFLLARVLLAEYAIRQLGAPDRNARIAAINKLISLRYPPAIPHLLKAMNRPENKEGSASDAYELFQDGPVQKTILEGFQAWPGSLNALLAALSDVDPETRIAASEVLGAIEHHEPLPFPPLIAALRDQRREVRKNILALLLHAEWDRGPALDAVAELLGDEDFEIATHAATVLHGEGARAKEYVPGMFALLKRCVSRDVIDLPIVAMAIRTIGWDAELMRPYFTSLLESKRENERAVGASCLEYYGPQTTDMVPTLLEALRDSSPEVRRSAASALGDMGRDAGTAIPFLHQASNDENERVQAAAAAALDRIKAGAPPAEPDSD